MMFNKMTEAIKKRQASKKSEETSEKHPAKHFEGSRTAAEGTYSTSSTTAAIPKSQAEDHQAEGDAWTPSHRFAFWMGEKPEIQITGEDESGGVARSQVASMSFQLASEATNDEKQDVLHPLSEASMRFDKVYETSGFSNVKYPLSGAVMTPDKMQRTSNFQGVKHPLSEATMMFDKMQEASGDGGMAEEAGVQKTGEDEQEGEIQITGEDEQKGNTKKTPGVDDSSEMVRPAEDGRSAILALTTPPLELFDGCSEVMGPGTSSHCARSCYAKMPSKNPAMPPHCHEVTVSSPSCTEITTGESGVERRMDISGSSEGSTTDDTSTPRGTVGDDFLEAMRGAGIYSGMGIDLTIGRRGRSGSSREQDGSTDAGNEFYGQETKNPRSVSI
jgi:hypothetical protein